MRTVCQCAWSEGRIDALALGAALCAVPLSIALAESLLVVALVARITAAARLRESGGVPRVFWFWLLWAGLETVSWIKSHSAPGSGEVRHLFLIAILFFLMPALARPGYRVTVWRAIFVTASAGSLVLVAEFIVRMIRYHPEIAAGIDPSMYLRSGGLLHHWMIYAVVEILVFAALLEFRATYPEERGWTSAALAINGLAILLSLTRALWLGCLALLAIHLAWKRSRWICALPLVPAAAFLMAPEPVRYRAVESLQPDYYSNAERLQMLRVGWKMIRERPVFGVGAGRVDALYTSYLPAGEPVPAYHGHLHNDAVHLAAQFGLPVLSAALLFLAMLGRALLQAYREARGREARFLSATALLGMTGFLLAGLTDYTYGHSLGLILVSFVALAPLQNVRPSSGRRLDGVEDFAMEPLDVEPGSPHLSRGAGNGGEPVTIVR